MTKQLSFETTTSLLDAITNECIRVRQARAAGKRAPFQRKRIADKHSIKPKTSAFTALRWAIGAGMLAPIDGIRDAVLAQMNGTTGNNIEYEPVGLDAEPADVGNVRWMGKYPVTTTSGAKLNLLTYDEI